MLLGRHKNFRTLGERFSLYFDLHCAVAIVPNVILRKEANGVGMPVCCGRFALFTGIVLARFEGDFSR